MANAIHLLVPLTTYNTLIAACDRQAPVHEHLANGIIEKDASGRDRVRIFCDQTRTEAIFQFVLQTHPELFHNIDQKVFSDELTDVQAPRRSASRSFG